MSDSAIIEAADVFAPTADSAVDKKRLTPESGVEQDLIERIVSEGQMLEINLPESTEDLKTWLIERENQVARESARMGFGYLALKSQIPHGEFKAWLDNNNLAERRVYELINVAKMLLNLPERDKRKLLNAKKSQLIELARMPAESIEEISEAGQLDDLLCLPVKELAKKLRNTETELDTQRTENKELKARLKKERATSPLPDFVVVTRHESNAMSEQALLNIDGLSQLAGDLVGLHQGAGDKSDEYERYLQMSATTLSTHLAAVIAKANSTLNLLRHNLPPELITPISGDLLYSDSELEDAIIDRADLVREHEQQSQIRANEREMNKPRGRGRPAKPKQ